MLLKSESIMKWGPKSTSITAPAVQELELEKSIRGRAPRLLRNPQASNKFIAFTSAKDQREWLLYSNHSIRIYGCQF